MGEEIDMKKQYAAAGTRRAATFVAGVCAGLVAASGPGGAAVTSMADPFAGLTPMRAQELSGLRAGFKIGPFEFDIGVVISSSVKSASHAFSVTTMANLNPGGRVHGARTEITGSMTPPPQAAVPGLPFLAAESTQSAPPEPVPMITATDLPDGGLKVDVDSGDFIVMHGITATELLSVLGNSQSGATLDTSVDLNIVLQNHSRVLNSAARNLPLIMRLGRDAGAASVR